MKKIKIFLASSIEDLREDRLQIGDFFRQLNELYLDHGIHFSLIKCEDYDNSIVSGGKQQEYDREIRDSELVFFLFFRKVGQYTKHEFEVALEAFRNTKKPRIITYFKYIQSIDEAVQEVKDFMNLLDQEMKHYYNIYGHIDTLKLGMLMQIKLLQLDTVPIKLENGAVLLDGQTVAKAENVPLLRGNQTLRDLTKKRQQLQAELSLRRSAYLTDPTEENETAFFNTSAELNRVSKQLTAVEQETLALLTAVAEMTADGRVLTHRQKEALKYFNAGNYNAVRSILEDEAREDELRRAELRAESAKNEIRGYVEEELLLIRTEKAQGLTEARVQRILSGYQKVMELTQKHDLDKKILYDYAEFLYAQNRHNQAIAVAEKLRWYYQAPDSNTNDRDQAALYNLLGILYGDTQRYQEAESAYGCVLELYSRLTVQDPIFGESHLAIGYTNLGNLYYKTRRYQDAEYAHQEALSIYSRLANENPNIYEQKLIAVYNNLGVIFAHTQRYEEAEALHQKALAICNAFTSQNPAPCDPDLAMTYHNLGNIYDDMLRYAEAEAAYEKALEIRIRLAEQNPEAYKPGLATNYNSMGVVCLHTKHYEAAEEAFVNALEIRALLASHSPEAYEPALAESYSNLGSFYQTTSYYEEAEALYGCALKIYDRLSSQAPDVYEPHLADLFWNLILLYAAQAFEEKLLLILLRAKPLFDKLAQQYPSVYSEKSAFVRQALDTEQ